jgi:AbrB family looped-hinge helix DNA binding protein
MSIVTVKKKYQIVIPARLRHEVGIDVGDILEAKVERGKIVFTRNPDKPEPNRF